MRAKSWLPPGGTGTAFHPGRSVKLLDEWRYPRDVITSVAADILNDAQVPGGALWLPSLRVGCQNVIDQLIRHFDVTGEHGEL